MDHGLRTTDHELCLNNSLPKQLPKMLLFIWPLPDSLCSLYLVRSRFSYKLLCPENSINCLSQPFVCSRSVRQPMVSNRSPVLKNSRQLHRSSISPARLPVLKNSRRYTSPQHDRQGCCDRRRANRESRLENDQIYRCRGREAGGKGYLSQGRAKNDDLGCKLTGKAFERALPIGKRLFVTYLKTRLSI